MSETFTPCFWQSVSSVVKSRGKSRQHVSGLGLGCGGLSVVPVCVTVTSELHGVGPLPLFTSMPLSSACFGFPLSTSAHTDSGSLSPLGLISDVVVAPSLLHQLCHGASLRAECDQPSSLS